MPDIISNGVDDLNNNPEPELQSPPSQNELESKLAEAERERDEYLSGWQRAKADLANYKRDEMHRLEEMAKYGSEELIRELIIVIDNFDLAIQFMEKSSATPPPPDVSSRGSESRPSGVGVEKVGAVEKGIYLIRTQFADALKRRGVEQITITPGTPFDPNFMEAIAEVEGDGPPGGVADEIEPGYKLNEKVIRPARVRLIKEKSS